jgi:oligopeptide/dipeptide ABC transporter ATP-binding protein
VGESGCGKTTLGRTILNLIKPTSGAVLFEGQNLAQLSEKDMRAVRKRIQIVFQDPYGSLNGRMAVGSLIREPLEVHNLLGSGTRDAKVKELLEAVGLRGYYANRYPHEFSGGQRQRIAIARALATSPRLIVLDEPVSALDVSVQSQVLNLLAHLKREHALTYFFISHDLVVVRHISDRIAVMYMGRIVELAKADALYERHLHPYTEALLAAMPDMKARGRKKKDLLEGDLPSPINLPSGCRFHTRCKYAAEACKANEPMLTEAAPGHLVACSRCQ